MPCIGRIGSVIASSCALAFAGCGEKEVPVIPAPAKTEVAGAATPQAKTKAVGKKFIPRSPGRD